MTKTRTRTYLLPSLIKVLKIDRNNCINLFLGIKGETDVLNGDVYLQVHTLDPFLLENNYYIEHTEYEDSVIIRFKYPYQKDYDKFINGFYSELSEECKQNVINYFNLTIKDKIYKILYKHPSLRAIMEIELGVDLKNYELGTKINRYEELFVPGS